MPELTDTSKSSDLIGRRRERQELLDAYQSGRPEFVALYGRRRVGKTFLVHETFDYKYTFFATALANSPISDQLMNFSQSLNEYHDETLPVPKNWIEAFRQLRTLVEAKPSDTRKLLFIDELPWLDTHKSGFIAALEHFWNGWAVTRKDLMLIICGSAASWMASNIIHNHGGLHGRLTRQIRMEPFTLAECEEYYRANNIVMNRYQMLEAYMAFGGIPYYLSLLDRRLSLTQNINDLCFRPNGKLRCEFNDLYASLFKNSERHTSVIRALSLRKQGQSRENLVALTKLPNGGSLTKTLQELEQSGFIRSYLAYGKKHKDTLYQLIDPFSLFYLDCMENSPKDDDYYWMKFSEIPKHNAWSGNAFEKVCLLHLQQIKAALGISAVITYSSAWRSARVEPGAQIDLVLDRNDSTINLCEMKYSPDVYRVTKADSAALRNARSAFLAETGSRKAIHLTLITPYGVARNEYSDIVQSTLTADDLFTHLV